MSEQELSILANNIDKEVEQKRIAAWGGFGKQLYHSEINFQLRSQTILKKLVEPITADQIQATEQALVTVKKELSDLIKDRKVITARFDTVAKRLMEPEKSIEEAIAKNEAALLKAKKDERANSLLKENKEKELKGIAEYVRVYIANMHSAILNAHAKLLVDAYAHALATDIQVSDLPAYLEKVRLRASTNTTIVEPKPPFQYNTQADINAEVKKHFNPWTPQKYAEWFAIDLDKKFVDWQIALNNKPQATELNKQEYDTTIAAIADTVQREVIGAKLDNIAMPVAEVAGTKQLKEKWVLPEPETLEQAQKIIDAFSINRQLTYTELRKIKPISLSVKQMIAALESVKNNDEAFEVTGLVFKKIEKL